MRRHPGVALVSLTLALLAFRPVPLEHPSEMARAVYRRFPEPDAPVRLSAPPRPSRANAPRIAIRQAPAPSLAVSGDVVAVALAQIGKPYRWGAAGPDSFDCSGYSLWAWRGVRHLPHNADAQRRAVMVVTDPRPGDLVFFGRPAHHVGIYLGAGRMVHAPGRGRRVQISPVGHPSSYGRP